MTNEISLEQDDLIIHLNIVLGENLLLKRNDLNLKKLI